jgi:Holliday junction DNA helicase RuvA
MICKIQGTLRRIVGGMAHLELGGGVTYEVMVPAYAASRLGGLLDQPAVFFTFHYLEGSSQGGNLVPRLAGFAAELDRAFFELFTTVKGIGPKRALRAMALPVSQIAAAVADRDLKMLQTLPEIGRRMAETIVAELHGKVDRFLDGAAGAPSAADGSSASSIATASSPAREAIEVLVQLGENRAQAAMWIDQVLRRQPDLTDSRQIIAESLRLKSQ